MRIHDVINRLWGDIAAQPAAVALLAATIVTVAFLAAVGLVALGRHAEQRAKAAWTRHQWRRSARLTAREPGRILTATDDRAIWHEAAAEHRPTCQPRQPAAYEIWRAITLAERTCHDAANHKDHR